MTRLALLLLIAAAAPLGAQSGESNSDIPSTHRPPPGMCRIWIDGVPAARQPAPTDCATAIRRRPPNARVVFGAEVRGERAQPVAQPPVASPPVGTRAVEPQRGPEVEGQRGESAQPGTPATPNGPRPTATPPRVERPPEVHARPRVDPPRVRRAPPPKPRGRGRP